MKQLYFILSSILMFITLNAQTRLEDYIENDNSISMVVSLGKVNLLSLKKEKDQGVLGKYFDVSHPGEYALPSKNVFIAIPPGSSVIIQQKILKEREFNFDLGINPRPILLNDSTTSFTYKKINFKHISNRPIVELIGYLWIDEFYCAHIRINQYSYNGKEKKVKEIQKIKLLLKINNASLVKKVDLKETDSGTSNVIINYQYATHFRTNKILINDTTFNWVNPDQEYLKIGTAKDAVYRLTKTDLDNFNIPTNSINPKTFKLYLKGVEIPIYVSGENDLSFDNNDYIEFVGIRNMGGHHREVSGYSQPYNEYLGRYTDTTVYWLTWNGENGKRVEIKNNSSNNAIDTLNYYHQIDHYERNVAFDFSSSNLVEREKPFWTENKTWHEHILGVRIYNKNFNVSDFVKDKKFWVFAKLQDFASNIFQNAHLLSLGVNSSNWSDSIYINKYQKVVLKNELSTNLLNEGNNILNINSIQTDATVNACIFDWYEIEYPRYLIPFDDSLNFSFTFLDSSEVPEKIKITNVSTDNFSLWRYGDRYTKYIVTKDNNNIIFADSISAKSKFYFIDNSKIQSPKIYYSKQFKNLRSSQNKADYIAITHDKFLNKVTDYVDFISTTYDVNTKVVNINDIYDEYSYGFFNPEAIKSFLQSTHAYWQSPKPKYVVLIGSATYDYYGNKYKNISSVKKRVINYVPSFGAPVSDSWFVIWDTTGAYIPQMNIGRIPVATNEQLDWYIEKHKTYVSQGYDEWNKRFLFFSSGDAANPSELEALYNANQFVIDNYVTPMPIGGKAIHFYKTIDPPTNFGPYSHEYIEQEINKSGVFISYLGHSGTQIWDNTIVNPEQLGNDKQRFPIVSDFGCSTGKFAEPDITSFSELFTLDDNGQAIAYVGNSSLGFLSTAISAPKLFYKNILNEKIFNVSEAHKQAKVELLQNGSGTSELFVLTNNFIGDPIINLPIPDKPNFLISSPNIHNRSDYLTDSQDSANFEIIFNNFGIVLNDSLDILIIHTFKEHADSVFLKTPVPFYEDTVSINLPIRNKAGKHDLVIILDPNNKYEEINENDNNAKISFIVSSSEVRPLLFYSNLNGILDTIKVLNPSTLSASNKIILEMSTDSNFIAPIKYSKQFGLLYTKFPLPNPSTKQLYWGRLKTKGSVNYSSPFSFYINKNKIIIQDSIGFSFLKRKNIIITNKGAAIDSLSVKIEVFSAGFNDGQAAIISKNGVDYVPTPRVGHHVVLFNAVPPYNFVKYEYFNTYAGGENIDNYIQFLDTLSSDYLVAIAISDEGTPRNEDLKNQLRSLGSKYIDSVRFRSSWALIGRKGAAIGTMPEAFSNQGEGPVTIDTSMIYLADTGEIETPTIRNSSRWHKLTVSDSLPSDSKINYRILGIRNETTIDTLDYVQPVNGEADLSFLNNLSYSNIKILAEFNASADLQSPKLYSLGVDYVGVPELGTNYQVVSIDKDSVDQGENINLSFYVYNVGESTADSFKVKVDLVKPDNSTQQIFEQLVDSIGAEQRKKFDVVFNTVDYKGEGQFNITIDSGNKIQELFEDNNFYSIPFYVKGDTTKPSLNVTFDGEDIFEGEYISATPRIKIELNDPSLVPINDTSAVTIFLNDEQIYYSLNQEELKISFSNSNPKVVVNYTPTLKDGEYTLTVFGKDANGNIADSNGISKTFVVDNETKLLNLYNYPNPFSSETYFTFKLTQIPDEIDIKVYTIAGRLVKKIRLSGNELDYDFNRIYWDGRDEDGDLLANGVYIYKVIMYANGKTQEITQKLAVVR